MGVIVLRAGPLGPPCLADPKDDMLMEAERYLGERAARGRKVNIKRILRKVPDVAPAEEDRRTK
jgi:hypothetical protein